MIRSRVIATVTTLVSGLMLWACAATPPPPPPAPPPAPPIVGPQTMSERTLLTMAADLAFPSGGFTLTRAGRAKLDELVPSMQTLGPGAKIVVYGYTDNLPVGPALQRQGIPDNLVLSTRRAATVVTFLVSQGVNANIISAKGVGDTRPVAPNDTPQGRAQNRRIEITVQGPGA